MAEALAFRHRTPGRKGWPGLAPWDLPPLLPPQNVASSVRAALTDATQAVVIEPNAFRRTRSPILRRRRAPYRGRMSTMRLAFPADRSSAPASATRTCTVTPT